MRSEDTNGERAARAADAVRTADAARPLRTIQDVARLTGTTSRTLRHYGDVGLLPASGTGAGGIRLYDEDALVRLQRILLLRSLGMPIPAIRAVLDGQRDDTAALAAHLDDLERERDRVDRRIGSVRRTLAAIHEGRPLMAEEMFDGFDHTAHREEVTERWGAGAYADSAAWWEAKSPDERRAWQGEQDALAAAWRELAASGAAADGEATQALAARQATALAAIPGTPGHPHGPTPAYLRGLGELYVADPRFGAVYGEASGFVRDALAAYADALEGAGA